jgi:ribosomal protein S18 acetylase RimI-like enzyme
MDNDIVLESGDERILDKIQELWEELNQLHLEKSLDFKQHYKDFTFQSRKESLIKYTYEGKLFIVIARHEKNKIGYCISGVIDDVGEIESIFVKSDYRNNHIGNTLMAASLNWIKSCNAKKTIVKVSVGNEEVFGFYSKYGFAPRLIELQLQY